jgi:hypothetical protein
MCPTDWQNQLRLSQGIIPQDMRSLLDVLKVIKNCDGNKKKEGSNGGKSMEKEKNKKDDKKRKVSFREERVPRNLVLRNSATFARNTVEPTQPMIRASAENSPKMVP